MSSSEKRRKIDELMEKASDALRRTAYFEAERLSMRALGMARQLADFERIHRIVMPLQESRRQRLQLAFDSPEPVQIVHEPFSEQTKFRPGCYLVVPPLVGADARRLRLKLLSDEVPAAVLCAEPLTGTGLLPIVAIGNTTIRTKIRPPKVLDTPDIEWFAAAMEALGDWAISMADPALSGTKLLDTYLDMLDSHPDHENLHLALLEVARDLAHSTDPGEEPGSSTSTTATSGPRAGA